MEDVVGRVGGRISALGRAFLLERLTGFLRHALTRRFVGHGGPFDEGACGGPCSSTIHVDIMVAEAFTGWCGRLNFIAIPRISCRSCRRTAMTHIVESRVIGNHADMGPAASDPKRRTPLDVARSGKARRLQRDLELAAFSRWDSEGGSVEP